MSQNGFDKRMEKLTEQSKQMKASITNPVYLIHRNPAQIEHVTREMASKIVGQLNQTQITKAYVTSPFYYLF
jgi:hypothetical protein